MLSVKGLTVGREREILRDVAFSVRDGEVLVIFGPNGAGKSTLLKAIMGVGDFWVKGEIYWNGENITDLSPDERAKRGIALMYQFPPEIEEIKVNELASILSSKFGGSSVLDVGKLAERALFVHMSGGERKIVEAYLTALLSPKLVMLDEPDSGLDIENVGNVAKQINAWIDEGASILLVTHTGAILDYIDRVDRAMVLMHGRIFCEGDVDEVYENIVRRGYNGLQCR